MYQGFQSDPISNAMQIILSLRKSVLFYPLIIAALPVIFFVAENPRGKLLPAEVLSTFAVVLISTAILIFLVKRFTKDNVKASIITTICLVTFFSYNVIHDLLSATLESSIAGISITEHQYLIPTAGIVSIAGIWMVQSFKGNLLPLIQASTFVALALVAFNTGRIGLDAFSKPYDNPSGSSPPSLADNYISEKYPDIYYIVLDSYGRADVLKDNFGFNNSKFIDSLKDQGFYVAPDSRSNYVKTYLSLGSSLNMRYLSPDEDGAELVEENSIVGYLKSMGYLYVHFDSGTTFTKRSRHADIGISLGNGPKELLFNEFTEAFLGHTIVAPLARLAGLNLYSTFNDNYAKRFHFITDQARNIPSMPQPTFSFIHILQPHPPYVFDRNGDRPNTSGDEHQKYLDQLFYVNKIIKVVVEDLLNNSLDEPIIVIQGDHGPLPSDGTGFNNPSDQFVLERTAILNAYYLPQSCRPGLYPSITPVNSFRMIFDKCLGTDFGLLDDRSYWSVSKPPIDFSQLSP